MLLTPDGKALQKSCANTAAGHADLIRWLARHTASPVEVGLEATGGYQEAVAVALHDAGHHVRVLHPSAVAAYGQATSARENGTPRCRADCRLRPHAAASALGAAAARSAPIASAGPAARCAARDADPGNESARARRPDRAAVDRSDARTSARRDSRHQAADRRSHQSVSDAPHAARPDRVDPGHRRHDGRDRPGRTARRGPVYHCAAAGGLYRSGPPDPPVGHVSPRPRALSKLGAGQLRKALYWPAITAMRHNAPLHRFAARLRAAGKPTMVIVAAVMRKLLHQIYGVLRSGRALNPTCA